MQVEKLRSLIRESIQEYIKEIDVAAENAAMEARIAKCEEAIKSRETKLENLRNLEEAADMIDEGKVKIMEKEIAELKKAKAKFEKQKEKMLNKGKKKEEVVTDAKTKEAMVDEADVTAQMEMSDDGMKEEALNESFLKMQKLAGVITESQYNSKKKALVENENMTIADFLNANIEEFKQKIADPGSSFEIIGDKKVATAGEGENGIDVSFDKEHMLKLFPENDPYNQVEETEIAGKKVYYNNYL